MIFIHRPQTDPFFNLAAEEFLLKNKQDDLLMLWQSTPSVVVGKHQNLVNEVNLDYTEQENIPVVRRLSGGGTVYHDMGNINLSVITTKDKEDNLIDFKSFTKPVIDFLQLLGVTLTFEGKNNLVLRGKKISGNSAHILKNRVLHHGTLLYKTHLDKLEKVVRNDNSPIRDKAVKSVRATVGNLSDFLPNPPETREFSQQFKAFLKNYYSIAREENLTETEVQAIEKLAVEKYKSREWNYGYSPKYILRQEKETAYGHFLVMLEVEKGIIRKAELILEGKKLEKIEQKLLGKPHDKPNLRKILSGNRFSEIILNTLF